MRFALKMALKETRASAGRSAFIMLAVAVGVGALTGVRGFSESVRHTLLKEARTLMAADISIRLPVAPTPQESEFLDQLEAQGIDVTQVTETVSMASRSGRQPVLVSVKGADLDEYPFYGRLEFDPPRPTLGGDSLAASDDFLLRLDVRVGDTVKVGSGEFRVGAVLRSEPDRMTTGFTVGPRVLMTRDGLDRSGLTVPGSRARQRLLLRVGGDVELASLRSDIEKTFGRRARVTDYTEANPRLSRGLGQATTFLSLVSLIALIVGGLGVASAIDSHLKQKMTNISILKFLGGRSRDVIGIYLLQALMLGLTGSVLGIAVGLAAQRIFPWFISGYFDVNVELIWSLVPTLQGMAAGLLVTLLFAMPSLLAVARIRPALILRRDMTEPRPPARVSGPHMAAGLIVLAIWGIAVWMASSLYVGSIFAGGLVVSVIVLALAGKGLLQLSRMVLSRFNGQLPAAVRHGMANLYRPGTHTVAILVALGVGVMFTLTVHLLEYSLVDQLRLSAPPDMPNVFLINVTDRERDGLWSLLRAQPGVIDAQHPFPAVQAQLSRVDGIPIEEVLRGEGNRRFLRGHFALTWSDAIPPATEILEGAWWEADTPDHLVSVEEDAAVALDLELGSWLEWSVGGQPVSARIASVRKTEAMRLGANNRFILTERTLEGFPVVYYGALRVEPAAVGRLQRAVFERFPSITVINAADILEVVEQMVDRISLAVRFVAGFAILGGVIILASSIAGTRYRRIREIAILKTVGATRARVVWIFSVEFLILGLIAGLIGSVLAGIFASVLLDEFLDTGYRFQLEPLLLAVVMTTLLTVATGWVASYRILAQKPLEVLRGAEV